MVSNGRKIAIIGSAKGKEEAPLDDPDWECWGLNNLYLAIDGKKCTRWYELHAFAKTAKGYTRRGAMRYGAGRNRIVVEKYMKDLAALNIPVYMQKKWDIIPKSRRFPFETLMKRFHPYFGCSFAWMLAHAIHEHLNGKKINTIGFWGVNLNGYEYFRQRPSTEFFMGMASGLGIKLFIHKESSLLYMPYVYAYKEDFNVIKKLYISDAPRFLANLLLAYQQEIEDRYYAR